MSYIEHTQQGSVMLGDSCIHWCSAGMEYLHSQQVVHFDLKCDNLLADLRDPRQPLVKIGDMGLSKHKAATVMSGNMRGTLPWMAPEMFPAMSASRNPDGKQVYLSSGHLCRIVNRTYLHVTGSGH